MAASSGFGDYCACLAANLWPLIASSTWRAQLCSLLLSLIALGSSGFVSMCATQSAQSAALSGDVALGTSTQTLCRWPGGGNPGPFSVYLVFYLERNFS